VHEDNEWGISLVATEEDPSKEIVASTPIGTEHAYNVNKPTVISKEDRVNVEEQVDLSDLMSQLKNLSKK